MSAKAEPQFPTLDAKDTVVRESQALLLRYRLMRALTDERGIRKDLRGAEPEPGIVEEMIRQLVPGVDGPLSSAAINWPIPPGVRLEALFASPWLRDFTQPAENYEDGIVRNGNVSGTSKLYAPPRSAEEFAASFQAKTGISPYSEGMRRNYRITPIELGRIAEEVRGHGAAPSLAYLLLCSRHFDEAVREAGFLASRREGLSFRRPLIDGFMLLAELEREALIVEDLGRLNRLSVIQIRKWLDYKSVRPLAKALRERPELKRLLDYQMIGTDAIAGYGNTDAGGYVPIHADLRISAAARGVLDVDLMKAVTQEGELARVTLRGAFPDRQAGVHAGALDNDEPAIFYGLNKSLAGAMQADLGRCFQHGDDRSERGDARQALVADAIVAHVDSVLHARNVQRRATSRHGEWTGVSRQRTGQAHAQLMLPGEAPTHAGGTNEGAIDGVKQIPCMTLPSLRIFGSAPRADPALWRDRWADMPFWRAFLHRRLGDLPLGLDDGERHRIEEAFHRLEALFDGTLKAGCGKDNLTNREEALHVVCDLATAVSAISTNRHFGPAIRAWIKIFDMRHPQPSDIRDHGRRWKPGMNELRRRSCIKTHVPSTGVKKTGTPRNRRAARKKLDDWRKTEK